MAWATIRSRIPGGGLWRVRIGYQLSITMLLMVVVLVVGLGLVVLSFDRARAITRSAAVPFIDHVAHACAAVLACRDANRDLNEAFAREGWPAYRTRFRLHTGEAVVGIVGSSDRMSYTTLGATVNLAARLEPLNQEYGTDILVSEAVRQRVTGGFVFRPVDTITQSGFDIAIRIYGLSGEAPRSTASGIETAG